jgi:hypothetical protein
MPSLFPPVVAPSPPISDWVRLPAGSFQKGGLETVTLEMIANDDVGAIKRIPRSLARAALIGLYRGVFDLLTANAVTTYDAVAWFTNGTSHYNMSTTALSATAVNAVRVAMRDQAAYGESRYLIGLVPKWLVVPNELEDVAMKLCMAANSLVSQGTTEVSDMPNINQRYSMDYIVVDYYTNAGDWWAFCDPKNCPTNDEMKAEGIPKWEAPLAYDTHPYEENKHLVEKQNFTISSGIAGGKPAQ